MVDGDNVDVDIDVDEDDDADDVDDDVDVEQCKVEGARVRGSFHVGGILSYLLMMLVIVVMTTPLIIMLVSIMYLMGCGFNRLDFSYLVNIKIYIIKFQHRVYVKGNFSLLPFFYTNKTVLRCKFRLLFIY